jgi:HSP20 family protein
MALNRFMNNGFDDFFAPFPSFFSTDPVVGHRDREPHMALIQAPWTTPSRGYEIRESNEKYHLVVEMPGIKASDMNVELEHEGRVLHISGTRKRETEDEHGNRSFSETHFDRRFTVGDNVLTEKMTGNIQDGILTLEAPKKTQEEKKVTKIPITESTERTERLQIKKE